MRITVSVPHCFSWGYGFFTSSFFFFCVLTYYITGWCPRLCVIKTRIENNGNHME